MYRTHLLPLKNREFDVKLLFHALAKEKSQEKKQEIIKWIFYKSFHALYN
jgi:DNA-binding NtrC family response regulator